MATIQSLGVLNTVEQKGSLGENVLSLFEMRSFFCPWTSALLIPRLLDSDRDWTVGTRIPRTSYLDWITPVAFLVLRLADSKSWDYSVSIIARANSYIDSLLYVPTCILSSPFLWRTLTNEHLGTESGCRGNTFQEWVFRICSCVSGIGYLIWLDLKTVMTVVAVEREAW